MGARADGDRVSVRVPREEFGRRRSALSERLAERGLEGWIACGSDGLFGGADHVRYLTDFSPHFEPVFVVGRGDRAVLLTGVESVGLAMPVLAETGVEVVAIEELVHPGLEYASIPTVSGREVLADVLDLTGAVGLVGGGLVPHGAWSALLEPVAEIGRLVDADEEAYALRAVKSPAEHGVIDEAYRVAAEGMRAARDALATGACERDVSAAADAALRLAGAEGLAIETMVGSGPNSATILARSTTRMPSDGDVIAVTVAPRVEGYCACLARPFIRGGSRAAERAVAIAWDAQQAALSRLRSGAPGAGATAAARSAIRAASTGATIDEVWVHSIGVVEFEPPFFGPGSREPVRDGMAMSIDVPLFGASWGGLRVEDGFVMEGGGPRPRLPEHRELFPASI